MEDINQNETGSNGDGETIDQMNDYERVILAAKLARKINDSRIAAREQLAPEEVSQVDRRKVTTAALDELESGTVQIIREDSEPVEETYDLT